MAVRVGINGFGRIGRIVLRKAFADKTKVTPAGAPRLIPNLSTALVLGLLALLAVAFLLGGLRDTMAFAFFAPSTFSTVCLSSLTNGCSVSTRSA